MDTFPKTMSGTNNNTNYTIKVISETNSIYFNGEIDDVSMENLINELLKMEITIKNKKDKIKKILDDAKKSISDNKDINIQSGDIDIDITHKEFNIKLYITTYGGSIYSVFGAIDVIKSMEIPVHTICKGCVASAGTLLSLAGKKKYITSNSYMLIHELRTACWGKFTYMTENYTNIQQLMNHIKKYYADNTKITGEELEAQLKQDIMWNAETCLEKGLVDEILL